MTLEPSSTVLSRCWLKLSLFVFFRLESLHAKLSKIFMPVQNLILSNLRTGEWFEMFLVLPWLPKALSKSSNTDERLTKTRIPSKILSNVRQHTHHKWLTNTQRCQLSPWLQYRLVGSVPHFFSVSKFLDCAIFLRDTFSQPVTRVSLRRVSVH